MSFEKRSFESLAKELTERSLQSTQHILVGIDGGGGAGKSCFSESLSAAVGGVPIIQMDDFYLPAADRECSDANELGALFDWRQLKVDVLAPLSSGMPARYQKYSWEHDRHAEFVDVPNCRIVIVEGCYVLRPELSRFFSYKIWLETPAPLRLNRGLQRDGESARAQWEEVWMPAEEKYLIDCRPWESADLIVDGSGVQPIDFSKEFVTMSQLSRA